MWHLNKKEEGWLAQYVAAKKIASWVESCWTGSNKHGFFASAQAQHCPASAGCMAVTHCSRFSFLLCLTIAKSSTRVLSFSFQALCIHIPPHKDNVHQVTQLDKGSVHSLVSLQSTSACVSKHHILVTHTLTLLCTFDLPHSITCRILVQTSNSSTIANTHHVWNQYWWEPTTEQSSEEVKLSWCKVKRCGCSFFVFKGASWSQQCHFSNSGEAEEEID